MISVAVFEDHPVVISSLKTVLSADDHLELIFCSTTKQDFFEQLAAHGSTIDVAIIDFLAEGVVGTEIYDYVHSKFSTIKVIAFTSMISPMLLENFLVSGVRGYVNKNQEINVLTDAVRSVYEGHIVLPDDYKYLVEKQKQNNIQLLSRREIEILKLIINEDTSAQIAEQLGVSIKTIDNHRSNIFTKLNVKNVAGMVREASKLGFV